MSDFLLPDGADAPGVTEKVPRGPVTEPLKFVRPPNEPQPLTLERPKPTLDLNLQQMGMADLPEPDAMAELERKARRAGLDPLDVVADPTLVPPLGTEHRWSDIGRIKPLADVLSNPVTARKAQPDIDAMVNLGGLKDTWIPENPVLREGMKSEINQRELALWNEIADNGNNGIPTPEQQRKLAAYNIQKQALFDAPRGDVLDTAAQVVQQAPQMARMVGGAAVGAVGGAVVGLPGLGAAGGALYVSFQQSRADAYRQMRSYDLPHKVAYPMSFLAGGLVAGMDTLSFGVAAAPALKAFGAVKGLEKLTAKTLGLTLKAAMKYPAFTQLLESFLVDGTTEGAQSLVNWLGAVAANEIAPPGERNIPTLVEATKQAAQEAKVGAFASGLFGGSAHVTAVLTNHITGAERNAETLGKIYDVAETMKLHERSRETLKTYAEALADGTSAQHVSVPSDKLVTLLQKAPAATQEWASSPDVKQRIGVAEQTGARVTLTMGEFLAHVRPLDEGRVLMQEIGLGGEMSATEAKGLREEVTKARKAIEEIRARKDAAADPIYTDLSEKLRAVGYTDRAVEVQATLLSSALNALAKRLGKTSEELYKEAPIVIRRADVGTTHYKLAERLLALTPEQRVRDAYIDPVAGIPNERAFRESKHEGQGFYVARPEGVKWMNDTATSGHGAADAMIRSRARSILALDPNAYRAMGGFAGRAASEADVQKMAAAVNASLEHPGAPVDFFWGATPEEAAAKADKATEAAKAAGKRAEGGKRPLGLPETVTADSLKFDPTMPDVPLRPEHIQRFMEKGGAEAFSTYVDPVSGLLTSRGMAALGFYGSKTKKHILSMDVSGVGYLDRAIGPGLADAVVARVSVVMAEMGLGRYDGAHPSGDEFLARAGGARNLKTLGERLYQALDKLKVEVYDSSNDQVVTMDGVALGWGVGEGQKAAETALQEHKAALKKAGLRDERGEKQQAVERRLSRRAATDADRTGLPRLNRDLGAGDQSRGGAAPNQGGAQGAGPVRGDVERAIPGFTKLYSGARPSASPSGFISIDADRGHFAVTLTGNANLSTFLHESGHYLFSLMEKYAARSPEVAADLAVLSEWAGVKPGEAWSVEALEKFARGFETYLMEGKAPSSALQDVFYTLKAWMKYVYRALVNLGAPLTDDVRAVMDRLVAPADEIDAARTSLGYKPSDLANDMTPDQKEVYLRQWEQASRQVEESVEKRAIAALKKERTAEYARIKSEVTAEVADHPVIELREFLTNPKQERFMLLPESLAGRKLSRAAVAEMNVPGGTSRLGAFLTDQGGVHPDELAPYFGFKNGAALVQAMVETPAASSIISSMVKDRMAALYPHYDPKGPWVQETVVRTLHESDAVSTALEMEVNALYRKAGLTPPISAANAARLAAGENVSGMSRRQLVPGEFINAEARFQREAQAAYAKKDFLGAAEATRKRIYSRAMWQAAQAAVKVLDEGKADLARYADVEVRGRVGKSSMTELPSGGRLGPVLRDAIHGVAVAVKLATTTEPLQPFAKLIGDVRNAGYNVMIDEAMLADVGMYGGWDNLPFDLAVSLREAVKNLRHIAADANKATVEGRKVEIDTIADAIIASLTKAGLYQRLRKKGSEKSIFRDLRAQFEKPETTTVDIDGGVYGAFSKIFMGSAEDGQFEAERRRTERLAQYHALAKKRPVDWHKRMAAKHVGFDGETYTGAEVFAMLLNMGSLSNRDKLIRGYGEKAGRANWSQDSVMALVHQVFPEQAVYDFAQAHFDFISQAALWEDSARVSESLYGIRPVKVESAPIPIPGGGTIKGGYYPVIYDKRVPVNAVVLGHREGLDAMSDVSPGALFAKHDFTNQRTGYVAPILLDPTALAAHIYEVDHFISNAEGVMMRHRVLTNPRVKNAIVSSLGYERWENLRNANNFIAADGLILSREKVQFDKLLNGLIYNNALLVMGGNVLSGVNQVVQGVPATLAYLGPRGATYFARSLLKFARNPFKMWEEVSKLSGEFRSTDFHFDRDLRVMMAREMTGDTWDMARSRIASVTMTPVVFGQKLVNVITHDAAMAKAMDEGMSATDAVRVANSAVRQSQSAAGPKDMTAIQRSHDGLRRILTSLASYTFALNDMVMPRRLTQKELAGSAGRVLMMTLTAMMTKALFEALLPELEKEDEERRKGVEKYAQDRFGKSARYAVQALLEMVSNVPLFGRTAASLLTGREPQYASWVSSGFKAAETIPKAWGEKGLTKADLKAVSDTLGLVTGIPTRHVMFAPGEFMHEYLYEGFDPSPYQLFQHLLLVRPGQKGDSK